MELLVQATWRDLQPGSSANLNTKVIEDALKNVRAYNSTYPNHQLGVRLRIFAGCSDSDNDGTCTGLCTLTAIRSG